MSEYKVISRFLNRETGQYVNPGEVVRPGPDVAARLLKANCIIIAESKAGTKEKPDTPTKTPSRKKSK